MQYIDLHCDTVTRCADGGLDFYGGGVMACVEKLQKGGCLAQCFAVFTQGADRDKFAFYVNYYKEQLKKYSNSVLPVTCGADFFRAEKEGKVGAVLTVENLGFLKGDLSGLEILGGYGVKMASLVWNYQNELAFPNLIFKDGLPLFKNRESRGLTASGAEAVEMLDGMKIIVDISHLSDGGARQILSKRKIPAVASHSNAAGVCGVCRNLTDELIKEIAACGGVTGVNFCKDFLGGGDVFDRILKHIRHLINTGGENSIAFGSDFDGIPEVRGLEDAAKMPALLNYLNLKGIKSATLEKIAYKNFIRVFTEVCG